MKTNLKCTFIRGLALVMTVLTLFTCALVGCEFREDTPDTDGGDGGVTEYYKRTPKNVSDVQYNALDYISFPTLSDIKLHKKVIDALVDYELAGILLSDAEYETFKDEASAEVKLFDTANITYTGRAKDESLELSEDTLAGMTNADGETGYDLVVGSGSFIGEYFSDDEAKSNKGFEEQLIGAKVGETLDITVTFPDKYNNDELCGAVVVFTVKINSLKRAKLETFVPTDEQCKKATDGAYETLADFKAYVEEYYLGQYAYELVYGAIEVKAACKEIVDIYVDDYIHEYVIYQNGEEITQEQYDAAYADAREAMYETVLAKAQSDASSYIISNYLFEYFSVTLTEEEFNSKVNEVWEANKAYYEYYGIKSVEDFIAQFGRDYIENSFKTEKLYELLPEKITIIE